MRKAGLEAELRSRCAASLRAALDQAAKKEGVKASELIRRYVQAGLDGKVAVMDLSPLTRELSRLSKDLGRVGGNLNQIAHYFNIHDRVSEDELDRTHRELQVQFSELAKYLKRLRRELVR